MDQSESIIDIEEHPVASKSKRSWARSNSSYARIVGKQRKPGSSSSSKSGKSSDPTMQSGILSSMTDRFMSFLNGESEMERKTRLRLNWYRGHLQAEVGLLEKALQQHVDHGRSLVMEFENQEIQLQKWGLVLILPEFRLQAWCRVSRSALIEEMTRICLKIIRVRFERSSTVIAQFTEEAGNRKIQLEDYNKFCLTPEAAVGRNSPIPSLSLRLARMDRICNHYLNEFRLLLPKLELQAFNLKRLYLLELLDQYSFWHLLSAPTNLESSISWEDFTSWYAIRHSRLSELEKKFASFVEDEREREGRLFRRWCTLALTEGKGSGGGGGRGVGQRTSRSSMTSRGSISQGGATGPPSIISADEYATLTKGQSNVAQLTSTSPGAASGSTPPEKLYEGRRSFTYASRPTNSSRSSEAPFNGGGGGGGGDLDEEEMQNLMEDGEDYTPPSALKVKMSPRSISAFIKYFAQKIIATRYEIKSTYFETLTIMTEALTFKRISPRVYRYSSSVVQEKDALWRKKCELCRRIDPTTYGVAPEYAFGKTNMTDSESSVASAGSSELKSASREGKSEASISSNVSSLVSALPTEVAMLSTTLSVVKPVDNVISRELSPIGSPLAPIHHATNFTPATSRLRVGDAEMVESNLTKSLHSLEISPSVFTPPNNDQVVSKVSSPAGFPGTVKVPASAPFLASSYDSPKFQKVPFNSQLNKEMVISPDSKRSEGIASPSLRKSSSHESKLSLLGKPAAKSPRSFTAAATTDEIPSRPAPMHRPAASSNRLSNQSSNTVRSNSIELPHTLAADTSAFLSRYQKRSSPDQSKHRDDILSSTAAGVAIKKVSSTNSLSSVKSTENRLSAGRKFESKPHFQEPGDETRAREEHHTAAVPIHRHHHYHHSSEAKDDATTQFQFSDAQASSLESTGAWGGSGQDHAAVEASAKRELSFDSPKPSTSFQEESEFAAHRGADGKGREAPEEDSSNNERDNEENEEDDQDGPRCNGCGTNCCEICQVFSLTKRIQKCAEFKPGDFGRPYAKSSRVMSLLSSSTTPKEIIFNLLLALKWLLKDASNLSECNDSIGADLMFPILVLVLLNANVPCMHLILNFLRQYGELENQGEAEYYSTCLDAAVAFIMRMDTSQVAALPSENDETLDESDYLEAEEDDMLGDLQDGDGDTTPPLLSTADRVSADDGGQAIEKLGEWLRDQQTMEDTITILQQEGWMV